MAGLKRIALSPWCSASALHLWLYNTVIVDTFYTAPAQLAAAWWALADPVGDDRCHLGQRRHGGRQPLTRAVC